MTPSRPSSDNGVSGIRDVGGDAVKLTVDYLKQEAITPLKGLGRFLAWGLAGSITMAVGILLLLVGVLRVLQEETGTALTGDWSWVPYFVVAVLGIGVVAVAAWRITAGTSPPMLPPTKPPTATTAAANTANPITPTTPTTTPDPITPTTTPDPITPTTTPDPASTAGPTTTPDPTNTDTTTEGSEEGTI